MKAKAQEEEIIAPIVKEEEKIAEKVISEDKKDAQEWIEDKVVALKELTNIKDDNTLSMIGAAIGGVFFLCILLCCCKSKKNNKIDISLRDG